MDSGSTPGNPYISEGGGLDIFQKVPYNMPIIRRSTKFQIGADWNKESTQTEYVEPLDLKLKNEPITPQNIESEAEKGRNMWNQIAYLPWCQLQSMLGKM